ncbi:hypothetical protein [Vibrio taketomensis]|nr:hypothetical protein [Vibrio taketomensis]
MTYLSQPFDKVEIGVAALNINGDKVKTTIILHPIYAKFYQARQQSRQ